MSRDPRIHPPRRHRRPRVLTPEQEVEQRRRLETLHESKELEEAKAYARQGVPMPPGGWDCFKPGCGAHFRLPRRIRMGNGKYYYSSTFCSQACHDAWEEDLARRGIPGPHWPKYDGDPRKGGQLLGWVLPKGRFVTVEEAEAAEEARDAARAAADPGETP